MSRDGRNRRLSFLHVHGTPREVGAGLGAFGHAAVHGHLVKSRAWHDLMALHDDPRVFRMAEAVRSRFARCWAELEGLAEGLQLPLCDVFLWNCRGDLMAGAPDGCTTVHVPGRPHMIGHNEDGDPGFSGQCALVHVADDRGNRFAGFVYPGSLPGHTFTATSAGLVQTVNNTRPVAGGAGVPRMVLTRSLLDAGTLDDAVRLVESTPRSGSFHLTLAQAGDERLLSVEFTAGTVSVERVTRPGAHANHLIHPAMGDTEQVVTRSSGARQRRVETLLEACLPEGEDEVLGVLRDTDDPALPIYRTDPADPDAENTLATAFFRVGDGIKWSVYDGAQELACVASGDQLRSVGH
jgi:hypothetical protein